MSISITLLGEPKSTSHVYKMTCRGRFATMYMDQMGKALKEDYKWQVKSQFKKKPLKGSLEIWIILYFGTKRRCDWDNFHKLSMDALTGMVWEDDEQILEAHVSKRYDKGKPRIEIEIIEM